MKKSLVFLTLILAFSMVSAIPPTGSRYWVGGSGTWTDTSHWSTSSGGAGGASVPSQTEEAIVDSNSGTGILTLDTNVDVLDFKVLSSASSTFTINFNNNDLKCNQDCLILTGRFDHGSTWGASNLIVGRNLDTAGTDFNYANKGHLSVLMIGTGTWRYTSSNYMDDVWNFHAGEFGQTTTLRPVGQSLYGRANDINIKNQVHLGGGDIDSDLIEVLGNGMAVLEIHNLEDKMNIVGTGNIDIGRIEHEFEGTGGYPWFNASLPGLINNNITFLNLGTFDITGRYNAPAGTGDTWILQGDMDLGNAAISIEKTSAYDVNGYDLRLRTITNSNAGTADLFVNGGTVTLSEKIRIADTNKFSRVFLGDNGVLTAKYIEIRGTGLITGGSNSYIELNGTATGSTTYYVSNIGSDSNDGLSTSTPFATFSKGISMLGPGVQLLFNKGDSWSVSDGTTLTATGGEIGSYGSGSLPVFILPSSGVLNFEGDDWNINGLRIEFVGNQNSAITTEITPSRTTCVAPCGIFFDGTGTTSTLTNFEFEELDYTWDFDDSSSSFKYRPSIDPNSAKGAIAAHVFDTPGTYTVSLIVKDNQNNFDSTSTQVVIQDPNVVFAGNTFYVSPTGDDSTGDGSITNPWKTWDKGVVELFARDGPRRVLVEKGGTYVTAGPGFQTDVNGPFMLSTYGSGADPIILSDQGGGILLLSELIDVSVSGFDFQGTYDVRNGITNGRVPTGVYFYLGVQNATVYQNSFSKLGLNIYPHGGETSYGQKSGNQFFVDNNITSWENYGFLGGFSESAILGNIIRQSPNTVSGPEAKSGSAAINFADHGPIRAGSAKKLVISGNDLFTWGGWSSGGFGHQPCLRLGTSGIAKEVIVSDNEMTGGYRVVAQSMANSQISADGEKIIHERNLIKSSEGTQGLMDIEHGGVTIRNNIFVMPNRGHLFDSWGAGGMRSAIIFTKPELTTQNNRNGLNRIYNNLFINYDSDSAISAEFLHVNDGGALNMEIKNNLVYAPYLQKSFLKWEESLGTSGLDSDNNLFYAPLAANQFADLQGTDHSLTSWNQQGFDTNSLTVDPELNNVPDFCDSPERYLGNAAVTITGSGLRTLITSTDGTNFETLGVRKDSRLDLTTASNIAGLDCNRDSSPETDLIKCNKYELTVMDVSGNTITLTHNYVLSSPVSGTIDYRYWPSTPDKFYVDDNSIYSIGDLITYNDATSPITVQSLGSDSLGDYVVLDTAFGERIYGELCKWPTGTTNFVKDYSLKSTSPAVDSGANIINYNDYLESIRPQGSGFDIGAFEYLSGVQRTCGNALLEYGEACDDGNLISGDGCSSSCNTESGYTCIGNPSVCSITVIPPTCGDGNCNGAETCSNCESDCGVCTTNDNNQNSGSSGGSGGGGSTLTTPTNPTTNPLTGSQKFFLSGKTYRFETQNRFIKEILLRIAKDADQGSIELSEKESVSIPVTRGKTLQAFEIRPTFGLASDSIIDSGIITFRVPESWVSDNLIDKEEGIKLARLKDSWKYYDSELLRQEDENLIYEAGVPGFSEFVIVGLTKRELMVRAKNQKIISLAGLSIALIIVGSGIAIIIIFLQVDAVRRRKKKAMEGVRKSRELIGEYVGRIGE